MASEWTLVGCPAPTGTAAAAAADAAAADAAADASFPIAT